MAPALSVAFLFGGSVVTTVALPSTLRPGYPHVSLSLIEDRSIAFFAATSLYPSSEKRLCVRSISGMVKATIINKQTKSHARGIAFGRQANQRRRQHCRRASEDRGSTRGSRGNFSAAGVSRSCDDYRLRFPILRSRNLHRRTNVPHSRHADFRLHDRGRTGTRWLGRGQRGCDGLQCRGLHDRSPALSRFVDLSS